jgi:hypothetical protein
MPGFWETAGNVAGSFAQGVGSVFMAPFDGGKSLGANAARNPYAYTPPARTGGSTATGGSRQTGGGMSDYEKEMARLQAQLNDIQARGYQAPPPEVIRKFQFDQNGALQTAKEMAQNAMNPIYKANMDNFLNRQATLLTQKKTNVDMGRQELDTVFNRLVEDNTTSRDRTTADTESSITETNTARAVAAREQGLDFDTAARALNEGLGATGMADSGLGRQQVADESAKMTRQSNEEVRQSANKVAAAQTLMTRTFEDLARSDTRGAEDKTIGNEKLTIDLNQYIEEQELDKTDFTHEQEQKKAESIAAATSNYQSQLVGKWIQSLYDQGATPAEILLASQAYGR